VEHRWGQRKATRQRVSVLTAGGIAAQGHIANASISGAFIKTPLPAAVLSIVRVAFIADNRSRVTATVAAQVVRKTAEGLGLEWCEPVQKLVAALAAAPDSGDSLTLISSALSFDAAMTLDTVE
jgi:hypothetical protein